MCNETKISQLEARINALEKWCDSLDRQVAGFVQLLHAIQQTSDPGGVSLRCQTCGGHGYLSHEDDKGRSPCPTCGTPTNGV